MKLIDDFFKIIAQESNDSEFRCEVKLNPDHLIYQVHFPGNPVTPGACLIQMANEILNGHFERTFLLTNAGSIKFKKAISSEEKLSFVFTKTVLDSDSLSTSLSIENEEVQFARMSLTFKTTTS